MSFHYTNFGQFGETLKQYADLRGFVPEEGDDHEDMEWDGMTDWDDDTWEEFVGNAVAATEAAEKAVKEWRGE